FRPNGYRLAALIQAIDPHRQRSGDNCREARDAEAAFEKRYLVSVLQGQLRVDDHMERHWRTAALGRLTRWKPRNVIRRILDDRQPQTVSDLRGREAHA